MSILLFNVQSLQEKLHFEKFTAYELTQEQFEESESFYSFSDFFSIKLATQLGSAKFDVAIGVYTQNGELLKNSSFKDLTPDLNVFFAKMISQGLVHPNGNETYWQVHYSCTREQEPDYGIIIVRVT